jgi:hypothetical protein
VRGADRAEQLEERLVSVIEDVGPQIGGAEHPDAGGAPHDGHPDERLNLERRTHPRLEARILGSAPRPKARARFGDPAEQPFAQSPADLWLWGVFAGAGGGEQTLSVLPEEPDAAALGAEEARRGLDRDLQDVVQSERALQRDGQPLQLPHEIVEVEHEPSLVSAPREERHRSESVEDGDESIRHDVSPRSRGMARSSRPESRPGGRSK